MKAICEGRKNKNEVIQESLDQYRDVYLRVQQQLPVLHAVGNSHCFTHAPLLIENRLFESMSLAKMDDLREGEG